MIRVKHALAATAACLCLLSCGSGDNHRYRIGVSQCSDDDWRDKLNEEIEREMLFHDDATVEILTANDDNAKQIADIESFIDRRFDIIVAAPNQAPALTPVLSKAYRQGIPVIIFDRGVEGDDYTSFIEFDNRGIGRTAAEYTAAHTEGPVDIVEIRGLEGSTPARERHEGFARELARTPRLHLVASADGRWKEAAGERVMDSLLRAHPSLKVVYAHNDLMAIGASRVLKAAGRPDVMVLGTDAAPHVGMQAVIDSVIDATFIYPTDGQRLVRAALEIVRGNGYPRHDTSPALPPVDLRNASILASQNDMLKDETAKILLLKAKNDEITSASRSQRHLILSMAVVVALMCITITLILRAYWQRNRFQRQLAEQNRQLEHERDVQLELYRQLDEATKSKLVFFTNVSHDLRTPLTLIAEPVEHLATASYLEPGDRLLMQIAAKNVKILRRLIDQILDLRRFQNGKSELHLHEADLPALIGEWVSQFRPLAASRHLRLHTSTASDGRTMAADTEKIERVLFNLMSNAFKYTPDGGQIWCECSWSHDSTRCVLTVRDSGMGISKADLAHIFERFYQVDKANPKGSGIGLTLVKAFVELHGGTIECTSEPGQGTAFTVTLPVTHVAEAEGRPDAPAQTQPSTTRIPAGTVSAELAPVERDSMEYDRSKPLMLLADDNDDILSLVRSLVGDSYNIITASNGREALGLATKYVPDIVVTDLMMPVMDGLELCRQLKAEISTSHIPVLMLTACSMDEQRLKGYESGADSYLSKPFNREVFATRCRNLLDNRERIRNVFSTTAPQESHAEAEPQGDTAASPRHPHDADLNDKASVESEFYRRFLATVKEELGNSELSMDRIASRLGLGQAQMTRKIKALTNFTPVEIVRTLRLKRARKLLTTTEKTISEIAYEVGFSSPPYLSKCFKDAYGESPSELRSRIGSQFS